MLKFLFLGTICITFLCNSQIQISQNCKADIDQIIKYNTNSNRNNSLIQNSSILSINGVQYLSLIAKIDSNFDEEQLTRNGLIIGGKIGNILSIKYPIKKIYEIYNTSGILQLKVASKTKANLDKVLSDTKVDKVHKGIDLPDSFTGKNVIIGVTDWGFDYSSPMFYDTTLQNTRIVAVWDQFKTSGPNPSNYNYGTELNSISDFNSIGSDTSNIYSIGTHGTHVAGIAGGSGAGTKYRGVAFESNFLFTTFLVDEGSVLDAWEWMYDKAIIAGKRLVINMSWGLYHTGAIDGTSLLSQALDAYSDLGVVFVTSAGNNGGVNFHIKKDFFNDTISTRILFYKSSTLTSLWGQSIHVWGEPEQPFSSRIRIINSSNQTVAKSTWHSTDQLMNYLDTFLIVNSIDTIRYNISMDNAYPTNKRPQMRLRISNKGLSYKVILEATSNNSTVHFWNVTELTTDVGNWGMDFTAFDNNSISGDAFYGIGAPACSKSAISVAAYAPNYYTSGGTLIGGKLAYFSSKGPLINEELKPDISGPGVEIASSINSYTDNNYSQIETVNFNGRDYPFARFSGTSMSGPVVTGITALILEANSYLSSEQVKKIIIATAREDKNTGTIPINGDFEWGWGKINAHEAIKMALNTTGTEELNQPLTWSVYPNPSNSYIKINNNFNKIKYFDLISINGNVISSFNSETVLDISNLATGIYLIRTISNQQVEQIKIIKQ